MKRIISVLLLVLVLFGFLCSCNIRTDSGEADESFEDSCQTTQNTTPLQSGETYTALNYGTVKAIWLSQFDMSETYTVGGRQRNIADYTARIKQVLKNARSLGVNTLIVQLRPNGDSIYPSDIYPPSKYACGAYGKDFEYDAFEIFLSLAHQEGVSVHAWINPLRCMKVSELENISRKYTLRQWYDERLGEEICMVGEFCYLDPAYAEVRELICQGVLEITEKYNVDGIHIDDYFYPTTEKTFDEKIYREYQERGGILSLADFRREQVNTLVRDIYATVKNKNHTLLFGISPGGNTERNYNTLYADVALWCSNEGYVDYICPQVYFGFEHSTHPFDKVCAEFSNMIKNDRIRLVVGVTFEKAYNGYSSVADAWAGEGADEWIENRDLLRRSVEHISNLENCSGVAVFGYRCIFDTSSGERVRETEEELENFLPVFKTINFKSA